MELYKLLFNNNDTKYSKLLDKTVNGCKTIIFNKYYAEELPTFIFPIDLFKLFKFENYKAIPFEISEFGNIESSIKSQLMLFGGVIIKKLINDKLVGFLGMHISDKTSNNAEYIIDIIYVDKLYRNQGIGKELVKLASEKAEKLYVIDNTMYFKKHRILFNLKKGDIQKYGFNNVYVSK